MPFYVRLLRQPTMTCPPGVKRNARPFSKNKAQGSRGDHIRPQGSSLAVSLTLTVTTDLGDAFLEPASASHSGVGKEHLRAVIYTHPSEQLSKYPEAGVRLLGSTQFDWEAGNRVLKVSVPLRGPEWTEHDLSSLHFQALTACPIWIWVSSRVQRYGDEAQGVMREADCFEDKLIGQDMLDLLDLEGMPQIVGIHARVGLDHELVQATGLKVEDPETGRLALRRFGLPMTDVVGRKQVKEVMIWEEMGESIARHVWDAALALLAFLASLCRQKPTLPSSSQLSVLVSQQQDPPPLTPLLRSLFSPINTSSPQPNSSPQQPFQILELGAGCGPVGLGLSILLAHITSPHFLSASLTPNPPHQMILTDTSEALPILNLNVRANTISIGTRIDTSSAVRIAELNWEWDLATATDSKNSNCASSNSRGPLAASSEVVEHADRDLETEGRLLAALAPDLILVSDCTYNPDTAPALVRTIRTLLLRSRLAKPRPVHELNELGFRGVDVLVALKRRHVSEDVFFTLMSEAGFVVRGWDEVALSDACREREMRGKEGERVEIWGFGLDCKDEEVQKK